MQKAVFIDTDEILIYGDQKSVVRGNVLLQPFAALELSKLVRVEFRVFIQPMRTHPSLPWSVLMLLRIVLEKP